MHARLQCSVATGVHTLRVQLCAGPQGEALATTSSPTAENTGKPVPLYQQATRHAVRQEGLSVHSIRAAPFPRGLSLFSPWEAVYAVAQ